MNEETNYSRFLNKKVKVILTPPGGNVVTFYGDLIEEDQSSIIITNLRDGVLLISKKDISQIRQEVGV